MLSTCNRMEVYVVALSFNRGVREVEEWMCKARYIFFWPMPRLCFSKPWDPLRRLPACL